MRTLEIAYDFSQRFHFDNLTDKQRLALFEELREHAITALLPITPIEYDLRQCKQANHFISSVEEHPAHGVDAALRLLFICTSILEINIPGHSPWFPASFITEAILDLVGMDEAFEKAAKRKPTTEKARNVKEMKDLDVRLSFLLKAHEIQWARKRKLSSKSQLARLTLDALDPTLDPEKRERLVDVRRRWLDDLVAKQ